MLFQVYGSQAGWQFFGWILVFICLIVTNEIARRTKFGGLFFFVILPIALTIYFITIYVCAGQGQSWALHNPTYVHMNSWLYFASKKCRKLQ